MNINYTLSVRLMTFNHAPFIQEAIESILMQKTNFFVEVVVGDDFSTDSTLDIIKKYKSTDNIHIKILDRKTGDLYWQKRKENGRLYNFYNILDNCRGKYIALLDGDDYWTDPLKLQHQVDFLEEHKDYVVTYHNAKIVNQANEIIQESKLPDRLKKDKTKVELQHGSLALTLTMCFRNVLGEFPKEFYSVQNGDTFLTSLLGNFGKGKYIDNITPAGYRNHSGGIWSNLKDVEKYKTQANTFYYLYKYHSRVGNKKIAEFFNKKYRRRYRTIGINYLKRKNIIKSIYYFIKHFN